MAATATSVANGNGNGSLKRQHGAISGPTPQQVGGQNVKTDLPIQQRATPAALISHSDWLFQNRDSFMPQENKMANGLQPVQKDKLIFWNEFADWARNNPVNLDDIFVRYFHDDSAWIFDLFPIVRSKLTQHRRNKIEFEPFTPDIGTRKVPFRNQGFKVSSENKNAVYTGQGFMVDYHHMKTPDGMAQWDAYVAALTSNLWDVMIYTDLMELIISPTPYNNPAALYPYTHEPRSVEDLMRLEQTTFGILNKNPLGIQQVCMQAARILEARGGKLQGFIAGTTDVFFTNLMDYYQTIYEKAGATGVKNRFQGDNYASIYNLPVRSVPFMDTYAHDGVQHQLLEHQVTAGSFVQFPDKSIGSDPAKYHSGLRTIKWCSHTRNDYDVCRFDYFLAHCFEFNPIITKPICDSIMEDSNNEMSDEGKINMDLLLDVCADASRPNDQTNPFIAARINQYGVKGSSRTNQRLSTLINHVGTSDLITSDAQLQYFPVNVIGEMNTDNLKDEYLQHVCKTMEYALMNGLSLQDRLVLDDLMELTNELNSNVLSMTNRLEIIGQLKTRNSDMSAYAIANCNKFGGQRIPPGLQSARFVPYGFGCINQYLSLEDQIKSSPNPIMHPGIAKVIVDAMPVYRRLLANMQECSVGHVAFSEDLVPFYMRSDEMSSATKRAVAAWYVLFAPFDAPILTDDAGDTIIAPFLLDATNVGKTFANRTAKVGRGGGGGGGGGGLSSKNAEAAALAERAKQAKEANIAALAEREKQARAAAAAETDNLRRGAALLDAEKAQKAVEDAKRDAEKAEVTRKAALKAQDELDTLQGDFANAYFRKATIEGEDDAADKERGKVQTEIDNLIARVGETAEAAYGATWADEGEGDAFKQDLYVKLLRAGEELVAEHDAEEERLEPARAARDTMKEVAKRAEAVKAKITTDGEDYKKATDAANAAQEESARGVLTAGQNLQVEVRKKNAADRTQEDKDAIAVLVRIETDAKTDLAAKANARTVAQLEYEQHVLVPIEKVFEAAETERQKLRAMAEEIEAAGKGDSEEEEEEEEEDEDEEEEEEEEEKPEAVPAAAPPALEQPPHPRDFRTYKQFTTWYKNHRPDLKVPANMVFQAMKDQNVSAKYTERSAKQQGKLDKGAPVIRDVFYADIGIDSARKYIIGGRSGAMRFAENQSGTLSASIFTALPFINTDLNLVQRSNLGCGAIAYAAQKYRISADVRSQREGVLPYQYDGISALKATTRPMGVGAHGEFYHDFVYHAMVSPPCSNNEATGEPTTLERRYERASNKSVFEMAAMRLVIMQSITVQAMQRWADCNVAIPFGGAIARPFEAQIMNSQIALGAKRLGTNYFSGIDSTIGFDQLSQHFGVQGFYHHCPFVTESDKYVVMAFTRGGAKVGGKGNKFVNERPTARAFYTREGISQEVDDIRIDMCTPDLENVGRYDRMGDYTNFPILQSYNTAVEGMNRRQFDIRGAYRAEDFVGRLEDADDFLVQDGIHFDGQFVLNKVFPFRKSNIFADPRTLSFMQYAAVRATNHVCSQVDQVYFDETGKEAKMNSAHLWEDQVPGLLQREQSMTMVSTRRQFASQKKQWLPSTN